MKTIWKIAFWFAHYLQQFSWNLEVWIWNHAPESARPHPKKKKVRAKKVK